MWAYICLKKVVKATGNRPLQAGFRQAASEAASEPEAVGQLSQGPFALQVVQQSRFLLTQIMLQALRLQQNRTTRNNGVLVYSDALDINSQRLYHSDANRN